ncbi:ATP-dependent DNA ligase [Prauserella marina]|uniref:Bifunctional non-homologous end joining protein LigD n=1 Tax=Prauserella marina TaxID=530584 RepID=A0A222VIR9_9PSEU|nr:non-homologous end-joining DNA ligase [Prauserella marina]ASR33836.1 ATP-dependent DNA ligase [Prauserella marina]PWV82421.1 bifunctional non-homologous end joining protein LigD [Prauserella marina]SDC68739.1 bifunctional non-homologous end joining protein LigD [Prauserella marina]
MSPSSLVSNPDKLFYPSGVSKGDVVGYYDDIAETMLPHLRGRPLTLRRYPDGIEGEGWFQKEASNHFPDWLRVEAIPARGKEGDVHHVVCDDARTLVYLANQATIEFHVWLSTVDNLDNPDHIVLDLDPPDGTSLSELRGVARRTRDLFGELGLTPFVQATGGRGYHVVAPLDAEENFDTVRELARAVADRLAEADPERLTTAQRKEKRGNRIFLDTNRNGYGQTFITPYSLRARKGAPVAAPLDWQELSRISPDGFDIDSMRRRLARKTDPWDEIDAHPGSATAALDKLT